MSLIHVHLNKKNKKPMYSTKKITKKRLFNFFVINTNCKKDYRTDALTNYLNGKKFDFGIILNKNKDNMQMTNQIYTIEPMYYMKTYTINQRLYMFIFYEFKYIVKNSELSKKFLDWLSEIFHTNTKYYHFFMVSESDPHLYMHKYPHIINDFFDIIKPHQPKIIFILPNILQPNSFNGIRKVVTANKLSNETKSDNIPITYNYLFIGSAASTDDVYIDAISEIYAHITIGENQYIDIHTMPKSRFDRGVVIHFIYKLHSLINFFEEFDQLTNSMSKKKEKYLHIVAEAVQLLTIDKYINQNKCLDIYAFRLYSKYHQQGNLYSESLQRVFVQKIYDNILYVKHKIYQLCVND